ncbi:hypothetical protein V6N11_040838 [Hibiscus sabdariffa]|uniref:Uncharacterized protein n=1 Tax=Hibiscus sabdariffa TaxID=183260 RepID=A0ABR2RJ57_9ROSI
MWRSTSKGIENITIPLPPLEADYAEVLTIFTALDIQSLMVHTGWALPKSGFHKIHNISPQCWATAGGPSHLPVKVTTTHNSNG